MQEGMSNEESGKCVDCVRNSIVYGAEKRKNLSLAGLEHASCPAVGCRMEASAERRKAAEGCQPPREPSLPQHSSDEPRLWPVRTLLRLDS